MTDSSPIVMVTGAAGNVGRALLATAHHGKKRTADMFCDEFARAYLSICLRVTHVI